MSEITENTPILWKPNPGPQTWVLQRQEREILYGGARGGGKTDAGISWIMRWVENPQLRFLVIRRNAQDLRDWRDRAKQRWKNTGAIFVNNEVRFPSGAKGFFGHLHDEDAYERYQGHEYQKMIIEELTHIPTEELYIKLIGSCRSTVEGLDAQIFCTTNPGNIGHKWVKKRFVDAAPHNTTHTDVEGLTRIFIPARVEDNPVLVEKDPGYMAWLNSLPAPLRRAWREGSWENFEVQGSYYHKWIEEARSSGKITKVVPEDRVSVDTWWDIGVGDDTSIGFFQRIGRNEWHMIDYYEASGEGLQHYVAVLEDKKKNFKYNYGNHWAPPDIEVREFTRGGKTRREVAKSFGIDFKVVPDLSIEEGIHQVRTKFNTVWFDVVKCADFLDKLLQYRKEYDEKNAIYRNNPKHDWTSHAADMFRYWAITPEATRGVTISHHS